jgi:hypothetical protein
MQGMQFQLCPLPSVTRNADKNIDVANAKIQADQRRICMGQHDPAWPKETGYNE